MAVTNTVQGLNSVIELLGKILNETKSNNDKTVQPRDVSSTSRVTANISSPTIETDGLNSLNLMSENIQKNADIYVSVIKTLTSDVTVSNIIKLSTLYATGILKLFNKGVISIIKTLNNITDLSIDEDKANALSKSIRAINDLIKNIILTVYSLFGVVALAAAAGYIAVKAFPLVISGIAAVTLLIFYIFGIMRIIEMFNKRFNIDDETAKNSKMGFPMVQTIANIMLSLAGLVILAAAVGAVIIGFWEYVLTGLTTLGAIMFLLVTLFNYIDKSSKHSLKAAKSIAILAGTMVLLSFLVFALVGVGNVIMSNALNVFLGFGTLLVMLTLLSGLLWVINFIGKNIKTNIVDIMLGVGIMVITMYALAGLVFIISELSKKVIENEIGMQKTMKIMAAILIGTLSVILGIALISTIGTPAMIVAGIVIAGMIGVILSISHLINSITEMSIKISKAKNDKVLDNLSDGMRIIIDSLKIMIKGLNGIIKDVKDVKSIIKPLNQMINVISNFVGMLFKFAGQNGILVPVELDDNGKIINNNKNEINIGQIANNISNAFSIFTNNLITGLDGITADGAKRISKISKFMRKTINPITKFAEMVLTIGKDPESITIIDTDVNKNGNIERKRDVKMSVVASNIASAFSIFIDTLNNGLPKLETDVLGRPKIGKLSVIDGVVVAINRTLEMLTRFNVNKDAGGATTITVVDENGKTKTKTVNFTGIGALLKDLNSEFMNVDISNVEKFTNWAEKDISSSSIWNSLNRVEMFKSNRSALEENASNVKLLQEEWTKLDNIMFKDSKEKIKVLKEYKDTMNELCKVLKDMAVSSEKISKMQLPNLNESDNTSDEQQTKPAPAPKNITTAVDSQNNIATNKQSNESLFDPSEIADAIKSGLSGSIIKFTFNDSAEDFIADMIMS